jgi:hypothetical protein
LQHRPPILGAREAKAAFISLTCVELQKISGSLHDDFCFDEVCLQLRREETNELLRFLI